MLNYSERGIVMNRRTFVLLGTATSLLVATAAIAPAARLPISTLNVKILSVERQTYERDDYRHESFIPAGSTREWYEEKTTYVAKAQIEAVLVNDHGLSPGAVIDIHYEVSGGSAPIYVRAHPLTVNAGERWTVDVFSGYVSPKGGTTFEGKGWKQPQPNSRP
jgi:hypothetical protein